MSKGKGPHIIDVGEPDDGDDGSSDLCDCISFAPQHSSCDGPPMDKWLARSCERPLAAGKELTSVISAGGRRY
jgi:hypothetical protein